MTRRAFTLIEVMICIAIVAIIIAMATVSWLGLGQLQREGPARFALRNARQQLRELEKAPFAGLPPQLLKPNPQGWLQLAQREIVADSVSVRRLDGALGSISVVKVEPASGRILVAPGLAGVEVMVDYDWILPDRNETQLADSDARVRLANGPARQVLGVRRARGARLEPVAGWRLSADRQSLELPPAVAGQVVVVDYVGSQTRNRASGTFLAEDLNRLDSPSPIKLLEIREDAVERPGLLHLSTLRCNR